MLPELLSFNHLKKNLKKDTTGLKAVKVALLGDSATQFLKQAIKGYAVELGFQFEIYEADYNQIDAQILDTSSELYAFQPEFVVVFQSVQKLRKHYVKSNPDTLAQYHLEKVKQYHQLLNSQLGASLLCFNFPEYNDAVFGSYAAKLKHSFLYQLRAINHGLQEMAVVEAGFNVVDFCLLHSRYGSQHLFDAKMYYTADMVLSIDALPLVARLIGDAIAAVKGRFKKCLILDLDNTMWGGIIGDDGIENIQIGDLGIGKAFTELQIWYKQLQQRGIILAVCSKNNETTAKEPFEKHPDMILKLDDIAVFVANWNNKADNIRSIQSILNIGFDSMVFLDDNPAERSIVRMNLPEVTVPELPEDPSLYLEYLLTLNLFETASYSETDAGRTLQYQQEAGRVQAQQNFTNEDDFLKSLEMYSEVSAFNTFNTPRVAQLSQRSNQFNLRTVRYSESDIARIAASEAYSSLAFTLTDRFGDNGLIAVIILKKQAKTLFIETWLMSCRVLKRGMEQFVLNAIVDTARHLGYETVTGEYIPTAKNAMVKDHYQALGFKPVDGCWQLDVTTYVPATCFIERRNV